jgi:long-chain fatty acid transport protein
MFFKWEGYGVVMFCLSQALSLKAGGFESGGLGTHALGMGGAFIAVADDWTAIYWNPAGLARLEGKQVGIGLEYVRVQAHDSRGLTNATVPFTQENFLRGDVFAQFGSEPSQFNGQDSDFDAFLPGAGFFWRQNHFTVAGGGYSPLGFAFEVSDRSRAGYEASYKSQGYLINHNLATLARTVAPGVHMGAGFNLVQGHLGRFVLKKAPTYTTSASAEAGGLGVQGVFGVLLEWRKKLSIGGVYRTGQNLRLKGHADFHDGRFADESTDYTQTIRNPTTYGVGLAVKPHPAVTLSADWQRTEWRPTRQKVEFDQPGVLLASQDFEMGWRSTSRYRFGAEWQVRPAWTIRAGTFRDPRAVSFESQALTGLVDPDVRYYTSGFSYRHARWEMSVANHFGSGEEVLGTRVLRKEVISTMLQLAHSF